MAEETTPNNNTTAQPIQKKPLSLEAKTFAGALAPLVAVDFFAHGGISGLLLCAGGAYVASVLSPVAEGYVGEFKVALQTYKLTHQKPKDASPAEINKDEEALEGDDNEKQRTRLFENVQELFFDDSSEVEQNQDNRETETPVHDVQPVFPLYPDDETLRLGYVVATGQRFDPHINGLFGKGMISSAVQGSGKSILNGLLMEQAAKCGVPEIVLDHKGEYGRPITSLPFVHGLRAGSEELKAKAQKDQVDFFLLEPTKESADKLVALVMEQRYQAIVDLPSYGQSWLGRADIVGHVGQALMRYSERQRKLDVKILPCLVFLDEAQLYLPQNADLLPPEAQQHKDVRDNAQNAFYSLVSSGRSNGFTICFATQSLTYIAKWAIKSTQIRLFMRHVEVNDLDMLAKSIKSSVATRDQIESFNPGTGVVFGLTPKPVVVHFDMRQSKDESSTPDLSRLREVQPEKTKAMEPEQMQEEPQQSQGNPSFASLIAFLDRANPEVQQMLLRKLPPFDIGTIVEHAHLMSESTQQLLINTLPDLPMKEDTYYSGGEGVTDELPEDIEIPSLVPVQKEMTLLEKGVEAYRNGATTQPKLAAKLGISPWDARNLMPLIEDTINEEQANEQY